MLGAHLLPSDKHTNYFLTLNPFHMAHRRQLQGAAPELKVNGAGINFIITLASFDFIFFSLNIQGLRVFLSGHRAEMKFTPWPVWCKFNWHFYELWRRSCPAAWGGRQMDLPDQRLRTNHTQAGVPVWYVYVCLFRLLKEYIFIRTRVYWEERAHSEPHSLLHLVCTIGSRQACCRKQGPAIGKSSEKYQSAWSWWFRLDIIYLHPCVCNESM